MNFAKTIIPNLKIFATGSLNNSPLMNLIQENNSVEFYKISDFAEASKTSWFHVVTCAKYGYAQMSRLYSQKRNVPYVLDNEKVNFCLSSGKGVLVLDASYEGLRFWEYPVLDLHENLSILKIDPENIVYITSSVRWEKDYKNWALNNNIKRKINVIQYNYHVANMVNIIRKQYPSTKSLYQHYNNFLKLIYSQQLRSKYYLCPNNAPRAHRVYVLLYLIQQGHFDKGILSLPGLKLKGLEFPQENSGSFLFSGKVRQLEKLIPILRERLPLVIDVVEDNLLNSGQATLPVQSYLSSYFSIVNETDFSREEEFLDSDRRFTEKVVQPFFYYHPFILVGAKGTLKLIRELGFLTFTPYINESYDEIVDPEERLIAIFEEIDRLCSMSKQQLHTMIQQMWPILDHNARVAANLSKIIAAKYEIPLLTRLNQLVNERQ